jgi:hypothetical protein
MKNLFFYLAKTDMGLIKTCTSQARNVQSSLGAFVLLTGILAFISGTYAISNMFLTEGANGMPVMIPYGWLASSCLGLVYTLFIIEYSGQSRPPISE